MPLVFAAIVPHPPLILPSIGREHVRLLDKTAAAYGKLALDLAAAKPDAVLIISPHLQMMRETFTVNHAPMCETHFLEFGDLTAPRKFNADSLLIERVRHSARRNKLKIITVSEPHLDHGTGVALSMLFPNQTNNCPPIAVVSPSFQSGKHQFAFGQTIKDALYGINKRLAVICTADLSHRHSTDTPTGFTPKAKEFDDLMLANLVSGSASPILQMNNELLTEAHACGYRAICMLMGILDRTNYTPELLAYENPFGVGYCSMGFILK